jgi:hypothetical protein
MTNDEIMAEMQRRMANAKHMRDISQADCLKHYFDGQVDTLWALIAMARLQMAREAKACKQS